MSDSKDYKKIVLEKLKKLLNAKQFKKNGNVFTYSNGDLTYFIGVQSSQSSTLSNLKITVNIEIASAIISKLDEISIPIKDQRHFKKRIGFYLDKPEDKWWTIDSIANANFASDEIIKIVNDRIFKEFESIQTTGDLARIWRGSGYIGTTESQRKKYLALLEKYNY